ncbi:hypothetical protein SAMN05421813_1136 [Daejeonella rubra]|uniref:Uncharacterized protein n=1 Tax=Daejeonella rubra TaxID=990371 RepID=A0A1G9TG77_9SPHI|nr:hypothetical protein [Daejeonella rubra]SDM46622.1 hypothetical protein SAMN05421813_1136 [Daejeonella rubra]
MKANHNPVRSVLSLVGVVVNISSSKNESKSQLADAKFTKDKGCCKYQ